MNKVKAIFIYYSQLFVPTSICSLVASGVVHSYGWILFTIAFWFKIITTLVIIYFNNMFREDEIYFYYNRGIRRTKLFGSIVTIDMILFILILILFFQPR
jgi:hypothetical protein